MSESEMLHCTILVAIGANLPGHGRTPMETCLWAVDRLGGVDALQLVRCSRWYRSAPVPPSGQPDYVNGVALLRGAAQPEALLAALHGIEAAAGRVRGAANAARTLDLDLLAMDALIVDTPVLTLPHPRLHQRAFVLAPLCDVAPGWVHPRLGRTASELLACVHDKVEILAGSSPLP